MRAAVFEATKKPLVVKTVPDPECAPNGAIIKVAANGVCRSDWHAWSGDWTWMGLAAQPGSICANLFAVIRHNRARRSAHRQLHCGRLRSGDLLRQHSVSFLLSRFTALG